ncbi:hypothetical protein GHT06_018636 [Daphnia sinensis]|uniref:Uncharacterized protein n=1 Tax=Daphnia sinensis TaxID=1820382 RepID=A0AAD5KMS5_9CRUS|nr:hypothetical protein GHT06_018636 [Daphnia sinensis]
MGGCKSANLCGIALNTSEWCECRRLSLLCHFRARHNKYSGRRSISRPLSSGGLETGFTAIQSNSGSLGGKSGPLCELLERSTTLHFRQPVPAAWSLEHRRSVTELEGPRRILSPPLLQLDSLLSNEGSAGTSGDCPSNTLLAQPMLVPILDGASGGHAAPSLPIQVVVDFPVEKDHPFTEDESIRLIAWWLSGVVWKSEAFHKTLSSSYWEHFDQIHTLHACPLGSLGAAGVINGTTIPCRLASRRS